VQENAPSVPHKDIHKIMEWIMNDHLERFELISEQERVEGKEGLHETWYVRAKRGHTIPVSCVVCVRSLLLPSLVRM